VSADVSVVIPTRNEAGDLRATLDAVLALEGGVREVVVVDASDDETPAVVRAFPPPVRLIRQTRGRGRAAARNEGILAASGEVVVVLNADVLLPPDFVPRILAHYAAGADYLLVESRVLNLGAATGRFVQAMHERDYPPTPDAEAAMNWTEGFSCRRAAALAAGLFPEGRDVTLVAGEDGWFGERLRDAGFRKVFDRSLVVTHVVPARLAAFVRQRAGRGRGWPQILRERHGASFGQAASAIAKASIGELVALVFPARSLLRGWRLSSCSSRGRRDAPVFALLDWLAGAAALQGMWAGVFELRRAGVR
jgi:glycosyltransferase involved in cell wall biosynthesis